MCTTNRAAKAAFYFQSILYTLLTNIQYHVNYTLHSALSDSKNKERTFHSLIMIGLFCIHSNFQYCEVVTMIFQFLNYSCDFPCKIQPILTTHVLFSDPTFNPQGTNNTCLAR